MRVPAPDSTRPASADLTSLLSSVADITKFVRSYFRFGGIAVGDPAALDDYAGLAACEYRHHAHLVHDPRSRPPASPAVPLNLPTTRSLSRALGHGRLPLPALGVMTRTGGGGAQLSIRRGGANAASLHDFCDPAFLGSMAVTLPTSATGCAPVGHHRRARPTGRHCLHCGKPPQRGPASCPSRTRSPASALSCGCALTSFTRRSLQHCVLEVWVTSKASLMTTSPTSTTL